ncbi:hypothetical protein ScPMuIL_001698 [Solemya velum]
MSEGQNSHENLPVYPSTQITAAHDDSSAPGRSEKMAKNLLTCYLFLLVVIQIQQTTSLSDSLKDIIKSLLHYQECPKKATPYANNYYIVKDGIRHLKECPPETKFSISDCKCVDRKQKDTPPTSLYSKGKDTTDYIYDGSSYEDGQEDCPVFYEFIFDEKTTSVLGGISSIPTRNLRFKAVDGATGKTAAHFNGKAYINFWVMLQPEFANVWRFEIRFKVDKEIKDENRDFVLIGDGPCPKEAPHYNITINPKMRRIDASLLFVDSYRADIGITDVDISDWVTVVLGATDGIVRLETGDSKVTHKFEESSLMPSTCELAIGKKSNGARGFVGYVDSLEFHNCY